MKLPREPMTEFQIIELLKQSRDLMNIKMHRTPMMVSQDEAPRGFGLDEDWQPNVYSDHAYEDRGEVVVDLATGLMWQKTGSENVMKYQDAQTYIQQLNARKFVGYADWRLPTIPELWPLMEPSDETGFDPSVKAGKQSTAPIFDTQ